MPDKPFDISTPITTAAQLAAKASIVAKNYKTLYVMGCIGAPMTAANKRRYCTNHNYNTAAARTAMIQAASADTFGFDCVCFIKSLLWGWTGDKSKTYGGAQYATRGVPDIGADRMIQECKDVSTDFSHVEVGEVVWISGHIGVYIGNGLVSECSPKWANGVQITACNCNVQGYNRRDWKKHGKLPYVSYDAPAVVPAPAPAPTVNTKTVDALAREVLIGLWGTGEERRKKLTEAGYDYSAVQARVNAILREGMPQTATATATAAKATQRSWKIGDAVLFTGKTHYSSANAAQGSACKPGKARITNIYPSGKHPYHLIYIAYGGSTVYGWVDANAFTEL